MTAILLPIIVILASPAGAQDGARGVAWKRHTIDASSRGADGVRLADANGDGLGDIVTGWEQGGVVRVCLHPGRDKVRAPWPSVTVGKAGNVEDAAFVDLDGDGALDVVSSCEGTTRTVFVHWAPKERSKILDPAAWRTEELPGSKGIRMWMYSIPLQVDGRNGVDLVVGSKGPNAWIGWFESPLNPRRLGDWQWHPLREVGWVMSLLVDDMDGDGDEDVVFSDRKGPRRGCYWLENPLWTERQICAEGREAMFVAPADLDQDGLKDVLVAVKPGEIIFARRLGRDGRSWESRPIRMPEEAGTAKAVAVGDIDLDGKTDVVFSCEEALRGKSGVMYMARRDPYWEVREVSGMDGVKYDLVELLDLDGDGDLDVLTCEEITNLGVIWYENPARP